MREARVGVIGGSGLYQIEGLADIREVDLETPYGNPSDTLVLGTLEGVRVAFLPRHGRGHRIAPSEVPYRANIYALKSLGVENIISVSAVGSLKKELRPQDIVIPDQLIDRTNGRAGTFFGDGLVVHVGFAEPFCPTLRRVLYQSARQVGVAVHDGGTCVVMEGPQFSTRAESHLHRSWGADLINMTALPEAKLAREAEVCYATLACVTDYDCWQESGESVTADMILTNLLRSVDKAKSILKAAVGNIPDTRDCSCPQSLKDAIATAPESVPAEIKSRLSLLLGKYLA